MMMGCSKCRSLTAWLLLLAGIGFLLADLGKWTFWNLQWYTVLILIVGFTSVGTSFCKDCKAMYKKCM
jgi:hypothetical protein